MGKLMEQCKLQMRATRKKWKKQQQQKQIPTFDNLNIDYNLKEYYDYFQLTVTNILDIKEPSIKSNITEITLIRNKPTVSQIKCPICSQTLTLDKHWNCYICNSPTHTKKIYEIKELTIPSYLNEII